MLLPPKIRILSVRNAGSLTCPVFLMLEAWNVCYPDQASDVLVLVVEWWAIMHTLPPRSMTYSTCIAHQTAVMAGLSYWRETRLAFNQRSSSHTCVSILNPALDSLI